MDLRGAFDPATVRDANRWQPLRYIDAGGTLVTPRFVGAHGRRVTPFSLRSGELRSSTGPVRYGSPEYRAQARALLDISAAWRAT